MNKPELLIIEFTHFSNYKTVVNHLFDLAAYFAFLSVFGRFDLKRDSDQTQDASPSVFLSPFSRKTLSHFRAK